MTDRPLGSPQPDPGRTDDTTRDVRLPPVGGRSTSHVPADRAGTVRSDVDFPPAVADAPAVSSSTPAVDPDPTIVVAPVGTSPEAASVPEQPTDEMRPGEAPRDHTRPFLPPTTQSRQGARGFPPPEQPVRENRGAAARRPAEATGSGAWTWVLLILLPVVVIAAAGVLLFLLLSG